MELTARQANAQRSRSRLNATVSAFTDRRIGAWLIVAAMAVGTVLHYGDTVPALSEAADRSPIGLAYRQDLERILFLLPVIYATYVYGAKAGIATLVAAGAVLLPHALTSNVIEHAVPEVGGVLAVGALLILAITLQHRQIELQKSARETLDHFVRQVLTAQEDERRRIALELHDDTSQALLLSCQRLDGLVSARHWQLPPEVAEELRDLRVSTLQTLANLRRFTQDLQPRIVDDLGLLPALEWLTDDLSEQHGIAARVVVSADLPELSQETQLILFRIAQEALRNVERHSGATEAVVSLHGHGTGVQLTVTDNGRGLQVARSLGDLARMGKLGVLGMHERARLLGGTLEISSGPGQGTRIVAELPGSPIDKSRSFDGQPVLGAAEASVPGVPAP